MSYKLAVIVVGLLLNFCKANGQLSGNVVTLFVSPDVEVGTVNDLRDYVSKNLRAPVVVEQLPMSMGSSASNIIQFSKENAKGNCVLGITSNLTDYGSSFVAGWVGVMSISSLVPSLSITNGGILFQRRSRTLAMCMIGRSLGLPPCGLPFCAMASAKNEKEFDAKAPNFCPFCQQKAEKKLAEIGIKVSPRIRSPRGKPVSL
jgi:hypothetical protein